jgi:hypothetical protein
MGVFVKITIFWNMTPWRMVVIYRCIGEACYIHYRGVSTLPYSEDGLSMLSRSFRYVGKHLPGNAPSSQKAVIITIE